jgi:hypothetical protein
MGYLMEQNAKCECSCAHPDQNTCKIEKRTNLMQVGGRSGKPLVGHLNGRVGEAEELGSWLEEHLFLWIWSLRGLNFVQKT